MFELSQTPPATPVSTVIAPEGEPLEFIYKGRRFHIHAIVSRWRESGGWWNRIDDGNLASHQSRATRGLKNPEGSAFDGFDGFDGFDDGGKAIWRVEAAPVGALATFEIELDEITGAWQIRPTSRPV